MGTTEDIKTILQDIVTPDMKAIKERLTALENKVDSNHAEQMAAIGRIADYVNIMQRLAALEAKQATLASIQYPLRTDH